MELEGKIRKIGNSSGLIIPASLLKEIGVENGDVVYMRIQDGEIVIRSEQKGKDDDHFKEKIISIIEEYMSSKKESK